MISVRDALGRGPRGPAEEEAYPPERVGDAVYYTSRQEHEDLTVVVKRFPHRAPRDPATPFVLVHGLGVSSRYFHPLAAELARRGPVFLLDLPGYGAAPDPRRDVTLEDHADAVAAMLRTSGIARPVLVGHSMGANVVSLVAERDPAVTDRLVLLAPTLAPGLRTPARAIGRLMADGLREPPRVLGIAATDYLVRCGAPYLLRQLPHLLADRLEDRMPRLAARVLVVDGDRDPIVPNEWISELAARAVDGDARLVRGPHVIMHTDPIATAGHILEFADASAGAAP
ncbi:alpha/beta hydrolase [Pseudolysinimonas kribbensis]|uniref:Dihydrolipoamide acetyltransferase n=1 Tax=Pseudolysinimonas kribbensis TaxID=433641 RepID=A0ABQ6KCR2_9MICO|nr:alpha/beta fold hydrolase [Pseudolysinimonas kribbensis]GMA96535.1 dihydrolipoamide acetyltransferase [Pseudolysinimonas kribbensis]